MPVLQESTRLGPLAASFESTLSAAQNSDLIGRIWHKDHTVWKPEPTEITNRLGWLHSAARMRAELPTIKAFVEKVQGLGYSQALLLGMGGSSLAPELFAMTFGAQPGALHLQVLDSTDPGAVLAQAARLDPHKTLFIVSTKSGGTVETASFFKFFYNWTADSIGADQAGQHFALITDPGSSLLQTAEKYGFLQSFQNDPNIGGRYSVMSCFGLLPAALLGIDLAKLIDRADEMAIACGASVPAEQNPGEWLGAAIAVAAQAGRDKLTLLLPPEIASFADWVEQLIAESTGKEGKGILPVVHEPLAGPALYGADRVFVSFSLGDHDPYAAQAAELAAAGHPLIRVHLKDLYDLGGQFFLWEFATAVAGGLMGIQPFDQPDVEAAKVQARKVVNEFSQTGMLPIEKPAVSGEGLSLFGALQGASPAEALAGFLAGTEPPAYIGLHAYLMPDPLVSEALEALRVALRARFGVATTSGYGPRFLHSTGQLHKGDAGKGRFIQFTADMPQYAGIPDEPGSSIKTLTFAILKTAQALGDAAALREKGRQVIRVHLGADAAAGLRAFTEWVR